MWVVRGAVSMSAERHVFLGQSSFYLCGGQYGCELELLFSTMVAQLLKELRLLEAPMTSKCFHASLQTASLALAR